MLANNLEQIKEELVEESKFEDLTARVEDDKIIIEDIELGELIAEINISNWTVCYEEVAEDEDDEYLNEYIEELKNFYY